MYRAKAAGRGGYERYDPEMHTELVQRVQLEADLRRALEAGELFLLYQPTFDPGPDRGRRGAGPLAPPDQGPGPADRVHPPGRGQRADPAAGRLGPARGLPAGGRVEDSTQFLALRRMGCDVGQGYYFGRPIESEEIGRPLGDDLPAPRPQAGYDRMNDGISLAMAQALLGGRGGSELPPHGSGTAVG
jgi:hypothetical protein